MVRNNTNLFYLLLADNKMRFTPEAEFGEGGVESPLHMQNLRYR